MDENRYTFKEQCFLYGRCYRGEFLKQILKQFIALANESELDSIKKAVASRKKSIRMGGAAGRPSVENEQEWFRRTVEQARQRFVVRMGWKDIAIKARMRDTPENVRQLQRWHYRLASLIYDQVPQPVEGIRKALKNRFVMQNLCNLLGLPVKECRVIVLGLADCHMRNEARSIAKRAASMSRRNSERQ